MIALAFFAPFALLVAAPSVPQAKPAPSREEFLRLMAAVHASHIEGNVPPEASFMTFLQRDVRAYLVAARQPSARTEIELLRKGPTQSGVGYPKYYLWVRAADERERRIEGAMVVAAVERVGFKVFTFTPAALVRSDPAALAATYPGGLIPGIVKRAAID